MKAGKKQRKNIFRRRPYLLATTAVLGVAAVGLALYLAFGEEESQPRRQLRQQPVVTSEKLVAVDVVDNDFMPRELTVNAGATVTWENSGDLPHNVVDDRGAFESPILRTGDDWTFTVDEPGTFYYNCTLHHIMIGTLTVVAAGAAADSDAGN